MKLIKKATLAILVALTILSCSQDESDQGTVEELSVYARNYLKLNSAASNTQYSMSSNQGNPVNGSFQYLYNNAAAFSNGRLATDSISEPSDTTIYSPWVSCAVITNTDNDDGSITTIYDYGDGCEEGYDPYKYWMTGKYLSTSKNIMNHTGSIFTDSYAYQTEAINYGGRSYYNGDTTVWSYSGTSDFQGTSVYDTTLHTYSGNYVYSSDNTSLYNDVVYKYIGEGKSSYTEKNYIIESSKYEYENNSDYYKTEVLEPLVMKFDCNTNNTTAYFAWNTYVSGREFIRYKQGEQEGSFEINYGDGTCDNFITIIENGKSIEVDLGDRAIYALD